MKIIVARYNEDINWTKQFPDVIIYNKGDDDLESSFQNIIKLKNVGREGHTYYTYIYENYDNLDKYTIFLQGNPFDHSPNVVENITNYINNTSLNIDFAFISELILETNISYDKYHHGIPLKSVFQYLFDSDIDNMPFNFGNGAQFIVSKETIHKHPKEFYLKIVKLLENEVNPIEGFVIERFHVLIFTMI